MDRTMDAAARAIEPARMDDEAAAEPGIFTVPCPKLTLHESTSLAVEKRSWIFWFSAPQLKHGST